MAMLQVSVDIAKDAEPSAAVLAGLQSQMQRALDEAEGFSVVDMAVRTEASVDPATLQQLTAILLAATGTVGAGTGLLIVLRKFASAAGALIRTVWVEIDGRPLPLDQVTEAAIDQEIAKP
jgi:hypothetical protein